MNEHKQRTTVVTIEKSIAPSNQKLMKQNTVLFGLVEFCPTLSLLFQQRQGYVYNRAIEIMTAVSKGGVVGKGDSVYAEAFHGSAGSMLLPA